MFGAFALTCLLQATTIAIGRDGMEHLQHSDLFPAAQPSFAGAIRTTNNLTRALFFLVCAYPSCGDGWLLWFAQTGLALPVLFPPARAHERTSPIVLVALRHEVAFWGVGGVAASCLLSREPGRLMLATIWAFAILVKRSLLVGGLPRGWPPFVELLGRLKQPPPARGGKRSKRD